MQQECGRSGAKAHTRFWCQICSGPAWVTKKLSAFRACYVSKLRMTGLQTCAWPASALSVFPLKGQSTHHPPCIGAVKAKSLRPRLDTEQTQPGEQGDQVKGEARYLRPGKIQGQSHTSPASRISPFWILSARYFFIYFFSNGSVSVLFFHSVFFLFGFHIHVKSYGICLVWLILLSILPSRSKGDDFWRET